MRNVLLLLMTIVGSATAQSNGDLRLSRAFGSSTSYTSGRLEIYYNGQWGTVCDDSWGISDSNVACRQLGYSGAISPYYATSSRTGYGSGTGQIWLDDVSCTGFESRLISCSNRGIGSHNCDHSEDVAIYCSTSPSINFVGIGVGVSIASLVIFVIIPIVICVVIAIAASRSSSRHTTVTAVQSAAPSTSVVTTSSQQQSAQQSAYPAAGTDFKQASPPSYEMSAYPPQPQQGYPQQGYPPQGYPPQPEGAYPPKGYPPQGYPPQGYPPQP